MLDDLLALILGGVLGEAVTTKLSTRADRRRLAEGRVRCTIRAVEARVLGIGTEWSAGECLLSPGRIRFTPEVGIAGVRDIEVLSMRGGHLAEREKPSATSPTSIVILTSPAGELYWVIPSGVAEEIRALVLDSEPA